MWYQQLLAGLAAFIIVSLHIHRATMLFTSHQNPHQPFHETPPFQTSLSLLECARRMMPPLEKWNKIEECVRSSEVYMVRNGRVPFMKRGPPLAYVYSHLVANRVFVTSLYRELDIVSQALVMIHECAHLALGATDVAYHWEEQFQHLTKEEHTKNADSYMHQVLVTCV